MRTACFWPNTCSPSCANWPLHCRVCCYATPGNLQRKSAGEQALLREHKLTLHYFGIESGSDLILKKITKGAKQKRMAEVLHKTHNSGMKISATVILGLGGHLYRAAVSRAGRAYGQCG
jgi:biotin synthase-like enzyme